MTTNENGHEIIGAFQHLLDTLVQDSLSRSLQIDGGQTTGPTLFTREGAARYLAMGVTTFDERRKAGLIKRVRDGETWKYRKADLDRYARNLKYEE